jgi:hypothetical protein
MSMWGMITLQYTYKANVKPGQNRQNSERLFMAGKEGGKGRPLFSCVDNSYQSKRDWWTRHRWSQNSRKGAKSDGDGSKKPIQINLGCSFLCRWARVWMSFSPWQSLLRSEMAQTPYWWLFAREFSFILQQWVGLGVFAPQASETSFQDWWRRASSRVSNFDRKGLNSLIILGAWTLWRHCNDCIFSTPRYGPSYGGRTGTGLVHGRHQGAGHADWSGGGESRGRFLPLGVVVPLKGAI